MGTRILALQRLSSPTDHACMKSRRNHARTMPYSPAKPSGLRYSSSAAPMKTSHVALVKSSHPGSATKAPRCSAAKIHTMLESATTNAVAETCPASRSPTLESMGFTAPRRLPCRACPSSFRSCPRRSRDRSRRCRWRTSRAVQAPGPWRARRRRTCPSGA